MKIASVEYKNGISTLVKRYFGENEVQFTKFNDFEELILADISGYDLILIDMSHQRCLELITYIKQTTDIPVIYLTNRYKKSRFESEIDDEEFVIHSYTREEFIQKVFDKIEENRNANIIDFGKVKLEEDNEIVRIDNNKILDLTRLDVNICAVLMKNRPEILSKKRIVELLRERGVKTTERAIREHVRKIRIEFNKVGYEPIETVVKEGYRWSLFDK
ncbi:MAG: winged helix-turn-helix domain-containing protein [Tissierellia bacterium]|nr:winged helix-turn-helix domain-containing protein [Tissierellia bacterium]